MAAGYVVFALLSAGLVSGYFGGGRAGDWLAGWAGLIVFPLFGALALYRLTRLGAIVTVGPRGVRDRRVSPNWMPWAAMGGISVYGTRALALHLDPAFEATMSLTRLARSGYYQTDPAQGRRGYVISASGLNGSFAALKTAVEDGLARARSGG
jgi:hypothetical protein